MRVGLFVPCYIDQFYPDVAVATLQLLERLGCEVRYPLDQTCCGQPWANAGLATQAAGMMRNLVEAFADLDYVVAPSGSCVLHVRAHYTTVEQTDAVRHVRDRTYELCAFLTDVLHVERVDATFPHRVGLHESCHGLRGLRLGRASEIAAPAFSKVELLLRGIAGLTLVPLDRPDECCGFGGTFAVTEESVSVRMGRDRLRDHVAHGVEVITGTDMSCLMHLEGLIRRERMPLRVLHVAGILSGSAA